MKVENSESYRVYIHGSQGLKTYSNIANAPLEFGQFVLPFSALSEDRVEPFTKEMEKAAIFCFAEQERIKGGGLILKQPVEKPAFIAEICYPFWLVPSGESDLLFDGLNTTSYNLKYKFTLNIKSFLEDLERSSRKLEMYTDFLSCGVDHFRTPNKEKEIVIDGLITDQNLLNDLNSYLSEATKMDTQFSDMVMLSPKIDEFAVTSLKRKLENLKSETKEEVILLYRSMKILDTTTKNFIETIRREKNATEEEYCLKMKKCKEILTQTIDQIHFEFDEQITKISKNFEEQLFHLHREKNISEIVKNQTISRIQQHLTELKKCVVTEDIVSFQKWEETIHQRRKELPELEAKIKELQTKIKEANEEKSLKIFKLRAEHERKIDEAKKDLMEKEASRDAKMEIYEQQIEHLRERTSTIIRQIDETAKSKETFLSEFEKLGIKPKHRKCALIYMPFYLVCYQSESKIRYSHFPPSIVSRMGFSVKVKGVLGKGKINRLLAPRFKTLIPLLNNFSPLIEQNAIFAREIYEAGTEADLLQTKFMSETVKKGLKQLKEEGWFSEGEYEALDRKTEYL